MRKIKFQYGRALLGALALSTILNPTLAHAHAHPTHQEPGAGSTVSPSRSAVVIDFDEGLEPIFSTIEVKDAQGKSVARGKAVVDEANHQRMSVALTALTAGSYTVAWVAVASDGHRTQGHYAFTVK